MFLDLKKEAEKMADEKVKGRIKIVKNGPYIVSGAVPLMKMVIGTDEEGNSYNWRSEEIVPCGGNYALCRCGQSKNKPFCDGTHGEVGFDGTEIASKKPYLDEAVETEGPDLTLTDVWSLCDHSRFCMRAGGIRKLIAESDNPEARELAIQQGKNCPSGRLVVWDKKTGEPIEPEFEQSIAVVHDPLKDCEGPIWVRGGIPIESADGTLYETRNRVTLCQCGKSENKPFCDGRHWMTPEEKRDWKAKWE